MEACDKEFDAYIKKWKNCKIYEFNLKTNVVYEIGVCVCLYVNINNVNISVSYIIWINVMLTLSYH